MGIFQNEAIRSLPEQVEKNKEDIKDIKNILENIDPDQVATILSDITSIKAEQVVQNTAIGSNTGNITANTIAINNEKTERESVVGVNVVGNTYLKTATANKQILIYNNGLVSITSSNNNVDITAPSGFARLSTDNTSIKADEVTGVTLSTNESDVPNLVILRPNGDFEVSNDHTLKFDNTGALTIDGNPIGGGGSTQLYYHNIIFTYGVTISGVTYQAIFRPVIINQNPNNLTKEDIGTWLLNNGYTGGNEVHIDGELSVDGIRYKCYIGTLNGTVLSLSYWNGSSTNQDYKNTSDMTIRLNTTTAL